MKISNKINIICESCGKSFLRTPGNIAKAKHQFCNRRCAGDFKKTKFCISCGSKNLYDAGWKTRVPVCIDCFKKWRVDRHIKTSICVKCGNQFKNWDNRNTFCKSCRIKNGKDRIGIDFVNCELCGNVFVRKSTHKWRHICNRCNKPPYHKRKINKPCVLCGEILNKSNRTHKSTHQKCDTCNYIRRRTIKDMNLFGTSNRDILINIRDLEALSIYGLIKLKKKEESKWTTKEKALIKRAKRFMISEH